MKKILMILGLLALLPAGNSFALKGGPFQNNTHGGLRGGTYQAFMMIPNGNGIARFSDEAGGAISIFSDSVVYYKGIVYVGNAFGSVDIDSGFVSGITNGTSEGSQNTSPRGGFGSPGTAPTVPPANGRAYSSSGGNVGICNTSFTGKVESEGASTRFYGDGYASFFGELDSTTLAVNVDFGSADEIDSAAATTLDDAFPTAVANLVTRSQNLRSTLGESSEFSQVGHRVKMKVFGSRINVLVPTPRTDTIGGTTFVANPGLSGTLTGSTAGQPGVGAPVLP